MGLPGSEGATLRFAGGQVGPRRPQPSVHAGLTRQAPVRSPLCNHRFVVAEHRPPFSEWLSEATDSLVRCNLPRSSL